MIRISASERRRRLVRRHHLHGAASDVDTVATSLVGLHATEPALVHLAVLARSKVSTLSDVDSALHQRRSLVRWMGMRRTLFVLPRDVVPVVQAAAGHSVAAVMRRQLIRRLELNGAQPAIPDGDVPGWLAALEGSVEHLLAARGSATGWELGQADARLRTLIPPRLPSDTAQTVTSFLLALMGAEGRIVRGATNGDWTSRRHRWEPPTVLWPHGLPDMDFEWARGELARRWLAAFGPAPVSDLQWWAGWNQRTTRAALAHVPTIDVDLDGTAGIALDDDSLDRDLAQPQRPPAATLLPTLDATPMGWKQHDWFFAADPRMFVDTRGNIGPTVWWDGEIIGGWAVAPDGEIRTTLLADRGAAAASAVHKAAHRLQGRLQGAVVSSSLTFPLQRHLLGNRRR
jgi:hypothetical protein